MLCDILHTVAKLHGSLQSKELNLATVPVMVSGTIKRFQELKEHPATSTWFKDHLKVFTETSQSSLQDVSVSEADKTSFLSRIYRPYIQSVIDHISSRMESSDIFSAFSIFDPIHLPDSEESLSTYGMEKLRTLTDFYGKEQTLSFEGNAEVSKPDVDPDQAEAEWKIFHRILFTQHRSESGLQKIVTTFFKYVLLVLLLRLPKCLVLSPAKLFDHAPKYNTYPDILDSIPKYLQAYTSIASLLFQLLPWQPLEYCRQP